MKIEYYLERAGGIEVFKILKKTIPGMLVIVLTSCGCEESGKKRLANGADDYLIQPCAFEELIYKTTSKME